MRVNWLKTLGVMFFLIFLIFLAWVNPTYFTARAASLGEPDPLYFIFYGSVLAIMGVLSYNQSERAKSPVARTNSKRLSLHNISEYMNVRPPQSYIDAIDFQMGIIDRHNALEENKDNQLPQIKYPELMKGEYSVYVTDGIRVLRTGESAEKTVIIEPTPLVQKHSDMVDFLGNDDSYISFRHSELPPWVISFCCERLPGFLPLGTEIIFADGPDEKQAVRAWDEELNKVVWCRGVKGAEIDYTGRIDYLSGLKVRLEDEITLKEERNNKERKKRIKKVVAPARADPEPAQAKAKPDGD